MAETYTSRTLREIVRVVASRFTGMVLIFAAVVAGVGLATYYAPKWYRSEVQLYAKPGKVANPLENQASMRDEVSLFVGYQKQVVLSDYVLVSALMRLEGKPVMPAPTTQSSQAQDSYPWYADSDIQEYISANGKYLRKIRDRVDVVTPGGPDSTFTQTFAIRVDWPEKDPEARVTVASTKDAAATAQKFAGLLCRAYEMRYTNLEAKRTRDVSELLTRKSLQVAKENLDRAATAQQDFVRDELHGDLLNVVNLTGAGGLETGVASLTTKFQAEINTIDSRLAELGAMQKVLDVELAKKDLTTVAIPDIMLKSNPSILTIQDKIINLRLTLNNLEPRYTPDYREAQSLRQELTGALTELQKELVKQRTKLDQEISTLTAQRVALAAMVASDRKRVDDLAEKAVKFQQLQKNQESAQAIYDAEGKQVISASTAIKLAENPVLVSVLDQASLPDPTDPRRPLVWLNMLLAVLAGAVLSLVYAFMADHFDHTIKGMDDAERYLGMPVLASVPRLGRNIIRTM